MPEVERELCGKHRKVEGFSNPELEARFMELPENQGTKGRHACVFCAYDMGAADERARIKAQLQAFINSL